MGSKGGVEGWVEGVAKVEAVARDKTRVPQMDMLNPSGPLRPSV